MKNVKHTQQQESIMKFHASISSLSDDYSSTCLTEFIPHSQLLLLEDFEAIPSVISNF